jgi:choline dehydrogenase-like flavoprotein
MQLFNTTAYRKLDTRLIPDATCSKKYAFDSDKYWKCYIESNVGVSYHSVGTCRMGRSAQDKNAVVDPKLR